MSNQKSKNRDNQTVREDAEVIVIDNWKSDYSSKTIASFYEILHVKFNKLFQDRLDRTAAQIVLAEFIQEKNEHEYAESPLPLPQIYSRIKRADPVIDQNLLKNGRIVDGWVDDAIVYWSEKQKIRPTLAVGSLLFSAAVFGGLNTLPRLEALYAAIVNDVQPMRVGKRLILPLEVKSDSYGNLSALDGKQKLTVSASYNFIFDDITLAWYWALQFNFKFTTGEKSRNYKYFLEIFFNDLAHWQEDNNRQENQLSPDVFVSNLKTLLRYAPYVWALDRCKAIPLWCITVAQDQTHSASQKVAEWTAHCLSEAPPATVPDLTRLNVSVPNTAETKKPHSRKLTRDLIASLRAALQKPLEKALQALKRLGNEPWYENELVLIDYFTTQRRTRTWKPSTYERYLDYIGHCWLLYSDELILSDADSEEYLEVYEQCLTMATEKDRAATRGQLNRFHEFLVDSIGAPPIELEAKNSVSICRSAIVPVSIYRWLLKSLLNADGEHRHLRQTLALLLIVGYRCGLRAGEICNIKMNDLFVYENADSIPPAHMSIYAQIRRKLKSGYAFRRIPLSSLMAPEERKLLSDYYRQRSTESSPQSTAPLFCWLAAGTPISSTVPNKVLQNLLQQYPRPLPQYVFHGFRHTAFSNWMMMFFGDADQVRLFTDYHDFVDDVRWALVGDVDNPQEILHAIAQVAGHATPGQTIESYCHWSHEIIGWKLSSVSHFVPESFYSNVCGWSRKQIRARFSGDRLRSESIDSASLRVPLAESLVAEESVPSSKQKSFELALSATPVQTETADFDPESLGLPGMTTNPFTILEVESLLQKIAAGQHEHDLTFDDTQRKLLKVYVGRAQDVYSRVSRTGKLRLVNELPGGNATDQRLSPQSLTSHAEKMQVSRVLENAYDLYKSEEWRIRLRRQIDVFLDRATATKSHIAFSKLECIDQSDTRKGALYQWLIILEKLFSEGEIRITGRSPNLCKDKLTQLGLHESSKIIVDRRSFSSLAGFQISIVMPGEKKKLKQAKQRIESSNDRSNLTHQPQKALSSWTLKYVFPMLYITWPDAK